MKISVISGTELDESVCTTWRALQRANPALVSPCFAPEFTHIVATVRPDVRVALMEDTTGVVGVLPFQGRRGQGEPVGAPMSDHHGVICAPGTRWDWNELLRATRLAYWQFDHLPLTQAPPGPATTGQAESPGMNLADGFEAYKRRRIAAGFKHFREIARNARRLADEVGPLRFEPHLLDDRTVFDTVLRLKSRQCRVSGSHDFFAEAWIRELAERIWQTQRPELAGRLSALYAGDTLVAAHLGMCSERTWHWWFPVYNKAQARRSPGTQLLLRAAEAAACQGHLLLDLGKGEDSYKRLFADCSLPLAEGWVSRPSLTTTLYAAQQATRRWLRQRLQTSPLLQPLKPMVRRVRRLRAEVHA